MRVLSLGAGRQSTTLLLMACEGEMALDEAIYADTGWEPESVYRQLALLEELGARAGIPIHRVSAGNIRKDALDPSRHFASMPLYLNKGGMRLMGQRQCTHQYKLRPIRRWLREHGATARQPAELLIGISLDEWHRAKDADVRYIRHTFPLIDFKMTVADCQAWLERHGYPEPPKSSCIGCPFRTPRDWRRLTADEMADAVDFDRAIRHRRDGMTQYLFRDFVPLEDVDLSTEQERGQLEMDFDGCGVLCSMDGLEKAAAPAR